MTKQRKDLYQTVTDQIVEALEAGTPPWIRPWNNDGVDHNPANLCTGRAYRGINVLLLNIHSMTRGFTRNRWLTYLQVQQLGGHIRRGEKGVPIVFFKMYEVGEAKPSEPETERQTIPLLRSFTVFNADQVEDLPAKFQQPPAPDPDWDPIERAEFLLEQSGATIRHGGSQAFYQPTNDLIQLPDRSSFASASDYYSTALHELTHWTGHSTRCNRVLRSRQEIDAYAFEELVAEIGSAFLTGHCRMQGQLQHASYISSWLKALKNDKRLIFIAAGQAQKAADYLLLDESAESDLTVKEAEAVLN